MRPLDFSISLVCALLITPFAAPCPPTGDSDPRYVRIQTENTWAVVGGTPDKVIDSRIPNDGPRDGGEGGIAGGGGPSELGQWAAPIAFPVIAIHASVLHTGEVIAYAYPGPNQAKVWNPITGVFTSVNMSDDLFCSGHSQLADGRLFVAGGNQVGCEFKGIIDTNIFDPVTRTWSRQPNMLDGRWYPTNVTLPDGRVLIFSGLNLLCEGNMTCEMFTPSPSGPGGTLSLVPEGERWLELYPRMHVLTNGKIAHVSPENSAWTFTPGSVGSPGSGWDFVAWNNFGWRSQGTSVLLPGFTDHIMIIGGNSPITNTCEIIDFSQPSPQFVYTPPMNHARGHANATILPDKTVLVVGGGQSGLYGHPILTPELYNPATATWTELPSIVHGRMYHSTSMLLPDGRVLVAGQDNGPGQNTAEIYSPRYLFRGPRPVITSTSENIVYGQDFTINVGPEAGGASSIESVVLMKLSTVTHSVNFEQRLLELDFVADAPGNKLIATAAPNANHAPPGYYLLFILNGSDVPSVAATIRVGADPSADINGDGTTNVLDLLAVISAWGPCPAPPGTCTADIAPTAASDGVVNVLDLLTVISEWG